MGTGKRDGIGIATATAIAIAIAVVLSVPLARGGQSTDPPELLSARERERVTRLEVEAARSGQFYLVADAGLSRVTLALSGVALSTYRVERIELGLPPADGAPSGAELSGLYHCQAPVLHPPNEIRPGEAAVPPDPGAPPTPGGADTTGSMPAAPLDSTGAAERVGRVTIECDSSLSVRIVSSARLGLFESLRSRLRLPGDPPSESRVRIILPEEDAERLFASLPAKLLFFVSRLPAPAATTPATTAR
jgi:hypothetical protein